MKRLLKRPFDSLRSVFKKEKAFTLIEVLFVVAVLAILAAIALPRIQKTGAYDKNLVYTASHRLAANMRLTRRLAITTGNQHQAWFSTSGSGASHKYGIKRFKNGRWEPVGEAGKIPSRIEYSGSKKITFSPTGSAGSNLEATLSLDSYKYRIYVRKTTGHVKLEAG